MSGNPDTSQKETETMPKHDDKGNSEHLGSMESAVSSEQKTQIYFTT